MNRGNNRAIFTTAFTPRSLFAAGEQGVWLDPSDLSTLYQRTTDAAPNVGIGDPVGRILDKSGRGNHASQTTDGFRPTLQRDSAGRFYLAFDGVDDLLTLPNSSMSNLQTANGPFLMAAAARRETSAAFGTIFGVANNTNATGSSNDAISINFATATQLSATIRIFTGTVTDKTITTGTVSAPATCVATWNRTSSTGNLSLNGVFGTAADQTQSALSLPLYSVGALRRGSNPDTVSNLNGRIYGLIVRAAATSVRDENNVIGYLRRQSEAF